MRAMRAIPVSLHKALVSLHNTLVSLQVAFVPYGQNFGILGSGNSGSHGSLARILYTLINGLI